MVERSTTGFPLQLLIAESFNARLLGLHAYGGALPANTALWIRPCNAVHTLGLSRPIDLVFLDASNKIIASRQSLRPWRMACCSRARSVVELPGGFLLANPESLLLVEQSLLAMLADT